MSTLVQWIAPYPPTHTFRDGKSDRYWETTLGWAWKEATWAGKWCMSPVELHVLTLPGFARGNAAVTVVGGEETLLATPDSALIGKLLVRCVAAPSETVDVPAWKRVEQLLPRIHSFSTIGPVERNQLWAWAHKRGWKGAVHAAPLGAEVPPDVRVGNPDRRGAIWLGRNIPEKRVLTFIEACGAVKVPCTVALALVGQDPNTLGQLSEAAAACPNFSLVTLGEVERTQLLQRVRVAATASHADSQWLPGTEIRACGGVGLAERGSLIQQSNGSGLCYFNPGQMAMWLSRLHDDDVLFRNEAETQHRWLHEHRLTAEHTGRDLWSWVEEAL